MRKAGLNVERRTEQYVNHANKGRRKLIFEPGDSVWLHVRKESFPHQWRSKLRPRRNGTFQVLEASRTTLTDWTYQCNLMLV